jgi:hypothetical protein
LIIIAYFFQVLDASLQFYCLLPTEAFVFKTKPSGDWRRHGGAWGRRDGRGSVRRMRRVWRHFRIHGTHTIGTGQRTQTIMTPGTYCTLNVGMTNVFDRACENAFTVVVGLTRPILTAPSALMVGENNRKKERNDWKFHWKSDEKKRGVSQLMAVDGNFKLQSLLGLDIKNLPFIQKVSLAF